MNASSVLDLVGNTALVDLRRVYAGPGRILAKTEYLNPGGSMKDRAARQIVLEAQADGRLSPGQTVVEMTSGNMGAGLAIACGATGHPFVAVMSRGNSPARRTQLAAFGAEVVLVDQVNGSPGQVTGADIAAAADQARSIAAQRHAFFVDQFNNVSSVNAHMQTGEEIWRQSGGKVDAYVCVVGSGASLKGVSLFLRKQSPNIRVYAVEPQTSRPLAGLAIQDPRHVLQGTGYGAVPPLLKDFKADGYLAVSDADALACQRDLGKLAGLFVGPSAAANVHAAMQLARSGELGSTPTIATLLCDSGFKYL